MVGIVQLVSAPDCGSGGRGFESLYPPVSFAISRMDLAKLFYYIGFFRHSTLGHRQAVRHEVLILACAGSNPVGPAWADW